MESLITINNGVPLLDGETASKIVEFERLIKSIKEQEDALRTAVFTAMEESGTVKLETDDLIINYISESDKETFNAKQFRKDYPGLYDDYITMSKVKAQIRIKLKEKNK